ncbi:YbhB/YbcL family Raf kinase inhibitor-like protein [Pseudogemmobacter bohemicus]|uniref:hypothetical protein n=1 Tax=Pseudogemmobacter bohemicus TaxID=2250708 RepID=UPI000DD3D120|nr:hypothetical protein [Pseudogemmobacter bohemicus]
MLGSALRIALCALALQIPGIAAAKIGVKLGAPWDGKSVPAGQQCALDGGKGGTPPMQVSGLPEGAAMVVLSFNDQSYKPLSKGGGHGQIGFAVSGKQASLPSVPGMTKKLPGGATVVKKAKSKGKYASPGYLPPCSGGKGHSYTVDVTALDAKGKALESVTIGIGRY